MGSTTFNKPLDDEVAALNSKLTSKTTWKLVGQFKANDTYSWLSPGISGCSEFMVVFFQVHIRQTILICPYDTLVGGSIFPDVYTPDGRIYCKISGSATQYVVSQLTGLSEYSSSAYIFIYAR
jgi:Tfp pilus tip-associated adhesin PilY1